MRLVLGKSTFTILLISLLFVSYLNSQIIPLDKFDYIILQRLYDKRELYYPDYFLKPFNFLFATIDTSNKDSETDFIIGYLSERWNLNKRILIFNPDFQLKAMNFKNPKSYIRFRTDFNLYGKVSNFVFGARTRFDTDGLFDPDYRGKSVNIINNKEYRFSAFHDLAYIGYQQKLIDIIFGKFKIQYGPGETGQMLISSNPPSFNLIMYKIKIEASNYPKFYFSSLFAQLDNSTYEGKNFYRTLYFQSYNLTFKNFSVGIGQTSIFADNFFSFRFNYFAPFISFFGERENNSLNNSDNLLYSLFFSYDNTSYRIYCEFLVDDISYDFKLPQKIGFLFGLKFPRLFKHYAFSVEYVRINRFTYAYNLGSGAELKENEVMLRYVFYGRKDDFQHGSMIGHWLGPDADLIQFNFFRYFGKGFFGLLKLIFQRKGEGNILEPTQPQFPKPKAFLVGIIERKIGISFSGIYLINPRLSLFADVNFYKLINENNTKGKNSLRLDFTITLKFEPFLTIIR